MSNNKKVREIESIMLAIRNTSADSILTRHVFAERAGMHVTDAECVDFLRQHGPLTAGQLATLSHLSKGAVTAMITRLKNHGIVKTNIDLKDNRRIIVEVIPESLKAIAADYITLAGNIKQLLESYSEEELATIKSFNTKLGKIYQDAITKK